MGRSLFWPKTVEPEGPGGHAVRSRPAPARMERKHDVGAGQTAGGCLPGPSHFSRVAERFEAQRRAERVRCSALFGGAVMLSPGHDVTIRRSHGTTQRVGAWVSGNR